MRVKTVSVISFLVAFLFGGTAFASVTVDSVTFDPATVHEGQQVTVTTDVTKSSNGCNNNVGYIVVLLNDEPIATTTVDSFLGSGAFSFDSVFNAPEHLNYTVKVNVWSGEEDFTPYDGIPDCSDTFLGSATASDKLRVDPADSGGEGKGMSWGGGGGMCSPLTGFPECQNPENYAFHGIPMDGSAMIMNLQQQVITLLQQWLEQLSVE